MEIKHRTELIKLSEHFGITKPVVAELGCAEGNFSLDLIKAGACHLYMVDNWGKIDGVTGDGNFESEWHIKNYRQAILKTASFTNVSILKGMTTEMAVHVHDHSLDILYIDAGHSYEAVTADLEAWYPKVKIGGIIAGHDYLNEAYGVYKAVHDFVGNKKQIHTIPENHKDDAGFWFQK